MVALDTYQDNFCLWRCIAVYRGSRPDRSTKVAKGLAKSFFKLKKMPTDCTETSLKELEKVEKQKELEKVEKHLNKGTAFSDWLGIRVYEPQRVGTEVVWHLTRNPAAQLKNIISFDNRYFWGARFLNKRYYKVGENLCMHTLQRKIHKGLQPSTSCRKVCPRGNKNISPW